METIAIGESPWSEQADRTAPHDVARVFRTVDNSNCDVDHSSAIVLINPRAEFAGLFSAPHDALARDLARMQSAMLQQVAFMSITALNFDRAMRLN